MASAAARGVFISYSRVNGEVVTIAAKLLRAGGATVFQDVVDIDYGADWQEVLARAIRQCERVLVFWSLAASTSEWVEREWRMALQAGKRIVPMLLDKTPLPTELSRFNGMPELMQLLMLVKQPSTAVDMPASGSDSGRSLPEPAPRPPSASPTWRPETARPSRSAPARRPSFLLPAIGVAFAIVFCGVLFYELRSLADRPDDVVAVAPTPDSGVAPGPAPTSSTVATVPSPAPAPMAPSAPASSAGLPGDAAALPSGGWSRAIVVALLLILGVAASFLFGRRTGKPATDGNAVRTEEEGDPFSVEPSTRQSWEESISILDLGRPTAASSDVQSRLVLELGPLFTRQLFD